MLNIFWDESFLNALITKRLYLCVVAWQSIAAPPFRPFFSFFYPTTEFRVILLCRIIKNQNLI